MKRALHSIRCALAERESGVALEGLAKVRHLEFDYPASMAAYESAYRVYRTEGCYLAAARCARTVGWFRGSLYGDWAVYSGWLERANSLLGRRGASGSEPGWLVLADAQRGDDLDDQRHLYLKAIEIARAFGDCDLECDALAN